MEKGIYLMNYSPQEFKDLLMDIVKHVTESDTNKKGSTQTTEPEKLLSRKEISAYLGITLTTLHKWMNKRLPYSCINGRRYFLISEVLEYTKKINHTLK